MTKKELKEHIHAVCDVLDNSKTDSPEYKEALEKIEVFQELLRTIAKTTK